MRFLLHHVPLDAADPFRKLENLLPVRFAFSQQQLFLPGRQSTMCMVRVRPG